MDEHRHQQRRRPKRGIKERFFLLIVTLFRAVEFIIDLIDRSDE